MSLLLDGIIFSLQRHGGISVYFRELLQRLQRDAVPAVLTLDGKLQQAAPGSNETVIRAARPLERYRACRVPATVKAAVFHSSYYRKPAHVIPSVVTVHDFTYERFVHGPRRLAHTTQKMSAIHSAQVVVCVSQSTLDDLIEIVGLRPGQRAQVILNGVSRSFRPLAHEAPVRPFVLFVGQRAGYKNFRLALRSLTFLPDLELLCVGGGPLEQAELAALPASVSRRVRHAGYVDDDTLNRLYNQAQCLVYPSRYEGFGIPVVEAMSAGCPVVGIECRAVLEVGGNALVVAVEEPQAFAAAITQTADSSYRLKQISLGLAKAAEYSWERCYLETLSIYRELTETL